MVAKLREARIGWLALAILWPLVSPLKADQQNSKAIDSREYYFDAALYSCLPDEVLTTYRAYGSGGVEPNATLGLVVDDHNRQFNVTIKPRIKSNRCLVTVKVTPDKADTRTQDQDLEYDLTDLTPKLIEMARDDDGRVYRLNVLPRLIEHPKPKQFEVSKQQLDSWGFSSSPVIVNDQEYMGQMSMNGGSLAWCDIPGLAKIEFSLLHLKHAEPLGSLKDGVIEIKHENGPTLKISGVNNGANQQVLAGGPYLVWVRWNKPTQTVEEYRKFLKEQIALIKQRVKEGEVSVSPADIERVEKMSESGHIGLMGCGVRSAAADELEHGGG